MNYKKIFKKGDGKSYEVQLRKIVEKVWKGLTFSKMKLQGSTLKVNYGGSTSIVNVGLTKSCIRRVGVMGVVFSAVFLAVWAVMPAGVAEAAFSCDSNDGTTCTVSGAKTMTKAEPIRL